MKVRCSGCAKSYAVADRLAGRLATCKKCGHQFKLISVADGDTKEHANEDVKSDTRRGSATLGESNKTPVNTPASKAVIHDPEFLSELEDLASDPLASVSDTTDKVLRTRPASRKKPVNRLRSMNGKSAVLLGGAVLAIVVAAWGVTAIWTLVSGNNEEGAMVEIAESDASGRLKKKNTLPLLLAKRSEIQSDNPSAEPRPVKSTVAAKESSSPARGEIHREEVDDQSRIQGRWQLIGVSSMRGQTFRPLSMEKQPDPSPIYKVFAGNRIQELFPSNSDQGQPSFETHRFELDPSKSPKQIAFIREYEGAVGRSAKVVSRGIYKFEGGLLHILQPGLNKPVPQEFRVDTPGDDRMLHVFRRIGDVPSAGNPPPPSLVWQPEEIASVSDDRTDSERIQGEWLAVADSASRDGFLYPIERRLNLRQHDTRYTFSGQILHLRIRTNAGGNSNRVFFELEPDANPKRFTLYLRPNGDRITPGLPIKHKGVYQFKDGRLWLLFAARDAAHPQDFNVNTPQENRLLCIFERQGDARR